MSTRIESHVTSPALLPTLRTANALLDTSRTAIDLLESRVQGDASTETQGQIAYQQKLVVAYLSRLRTQARALAYTIRDTKAITTESRAEVDRLLLQLQNLHYEQQHLLGEIAACEEYDHAYARLPLVDVQEYLSFHPEHDELDEDELMPKRIEFEDEERRRLEAEMEVLRKEKEELARVVEQRRTELRNWDEKVETWLAGREDVSRELNEKQELPR